MISRTCRALALALRAQLDKPRAPGVIVLAALLLTSCVLTLGLTGDDYFHLAGVRGGTKSEGLPLSPWDLFAFARGDEVGAQILIDQGTLPWWSDKSVVLAFFRPLSSLTHWLDYALWPEQHALIHLHSLLWFALLLLVVSRLYQRLLPAPWLASLALLFYALDDARASLVGWVATRNLMIAMAGAFLSLLLHHRARAERDKKLQLLALLVFALALLAGESTVQVGGYLFGYALFVDRASLRARLGSLLPYLGILLLWRIPYSQLGYGAHGSGLYFDPAHEPVQFLAALMLRLPTLLLSLVALPFSDLYDGFSVIEPRLVPWFFAFAALALGNFAWLLRPLWVREPLVRFWTVGALLAAIPVCAGPIDDRLLAGPGVGCAAVLAHFFGALLDGTYPKKTLLVRASACALALIHGVLGPLLLPVRTLSVDAFEALMDRADESIPSDPAVLDKTVVVLNPPVDLYAVYFPLYRAAHHIPQPARFRWLATGVTALDIERVDPRTLRIRAEAGFLSNSTQWMFRGPKLPFAVGQTVELSESSIQISALTRDERPAEVLVRFHEALESPALQFLQWGKQAYVPFVLPAVGQSVHVPAVDLFAAMFGPKEPS